MAEINHQILVDYFKSLAENLIGIEDFHRMNLVEIQGSFRSSASFPCLVLESHDADWGDSNLQQSIKDRNIAFTVMTKPEKANFEDQDTKLTESEILGDKILARMRHDANNPNHFLYNHFKIENVKSSKVGPLFSERLFGYRNVCSINAPKKLILDPADWQDIETTCAHP